MAATDTAMAEQISLRGKSVVVAISGVDIGTGLSAGLLERGAHVALLSDNREVLDSAPAGVSVIAVDFAERSSVASGFAQAAQHHGAPTLVVLSALPSAVAHSKALADLSDAEWLGGARSAIRSVLHCLQSASASLQENAGTVALIGPSLALVGCRNLVALTTALEGQRGLMKSVARQWGHSGATLNWIACNARTLSPLFAQLPLPTKADAVPVALGRAPQLRADIVPVLEFLASPAGHAMTGMTLTLDGGEWMLP
jgi:3-oxoacyl-[acyl-carrier protein] reductase